VLQALTPAQARTSEITRQKKDLQAQLNKEAKTRNDKQMRLIDWNCDVLIRLLKMIVAQRESASIKPDDTNQIDALETEISSRTKMVLEEVAEVIQLPHFDSAAAKNTITPETIDLGNEVMEQLREYVSTIAAMYHQVRIVCDLLPTMVGYISFYTDTPPSNFLHLEPLP